MEVFGGNKEFVIFSFFCYTLQTSLGGTAKIGDTHPYVCHPPNLSRGIRRTGTGKSQ